MATIFLLLGSNQGNRQMFLQQAIAMIEVDVVPPAKASAVYETQAWGKTDEADYLNQVLLLKTTIAPRLLLEKLLHIEQVLGRQRGERWGSRVIDIDILFYGDKVINERDLQIPHPRLHLRRFTLEPLAEIAPRLIHPVLHKTITEIKTELKDSLVVKKI